MLVMELSTKQTRKKVRSQRPPNQWCINTSVIVIVKVKAIMRFMDDRVLSTILYKGVKYIVRKYFNFIIV